MRSARAPLVLLLAVVGCASPGSTQHGPGSGSGGSSGGAGNGGSSGGGGTSATGPWDDFPDHPIVDIGAPADAPTLFGAPDQPGATGPCLSDPPIGALLPRNWLRPRFRIQGAQQNLFEIRVHAANELHDLVVYTTRDTWTMDAQSWGRLSAHIADEPITITVRGASYSGGALSSGPALGSHGDITIAPARADGAIVYWTNSNGTALRGFHMGDESVRDVLRPAQSGAACIGCHGSTPDGKFVAFAASPTSGSGNPAAVLMRSADGSDAVPSFMTPSAATLLQRTDQDFPVFSKAHWTSGDRIMISIFNGTGRYELAWTNLEAQSTAQGSGWDIVPRPGDSGEAGAGSFSHDGRAIVYTSGSSVSNGSEVHDGDLRVVPYPAQPGGMSLAVHGASDAALNEFYPTWSPDDRLIAFNRLPKGENSYSNAASEVFVVPFDAPAGTTATRLVANDGPACTGVVSPGLTNSFPKWAPDVTVDGTRTYYWLTFSSKREDGQTPQLYVAPVVVDGTEMKTYPALYLWNQPADESNHTPAWDHFDIPIS